MAYRNLPAQTFAQPLRGVSEPLHVQAQVAWCFLMTCTNLLLINGSCSVNNFLALSKHLHLSFVDRSPGISHAPPISNSMMSTSSGFFAA